VCLFFFLENDDFFCNLVFFLSAAATILYGGSFDGNGVFVQLD